MQSIIIFINLSFGMMAFECLVRVVIIVISKGLVTIAKSINGRDIWRQVCKSKTRLVYWLAEYFLFESLKYLAKILVYMNGVNLTKKLLI